MTRSGWGRGPGVGRGVCVWKNLVALYFFHMVCVAKKDFMYLYFPLRIVTGL